ncbi:MAG: membrane protein YqaA with SNARE-associated domain [Myxococcota bacterium]|jgi:membrane protein YqaA with SNARE-associated domain
MSGTIDTEAAAAGEADPLDLKRIAIRMVLGTLLIVVAVGGVLFIFKDELVSVSGWFVDTLGGPGVALGFFLPDAFTVPLPNDAFTFLGYMSGQLSFWECVAWGSLGSLTGGSVGFFIGRGFQRTLWFQKLMATRGREITALVSRYGKTALLIAALTPIPYSVACWAVGAGGMRFRWFFIISLSRILKVAFYLWLLVEGVLSSFDGYVPT